MVGLSVCARPFEVCDNWRNPDGVEPHILDVIQVIDDSLVGTSAILAVLCVASWPRPIRKCKPVGDKLVTLA